MTNIPTHPPPVTPAAWNQMATYFNQLQALGLDWNTIISYLTGLTASGIVASHQTFLIRKIGAYYEAIDNAGHLAYGGSENAGEVDGTDAVAVSQAAANFMGVNGGAIHVQKGSYSGTGSLTMSNYPIALIGEDRSKTILNFPVVIEDTVGDRFHEVSHLTLNAPSHEGIGLTLAGVSRMNSYSLTSYGWDIGVKLSNHSFMNNFFGLHCRANNVGLLTERLEEQSTCAHNQFFGGYLISNHEYGVKIRGNVSHTAFWGSEIEANVLGQIYLETLVEGLVPSENQFIGCYLEGATGYMTNPLIQFYTPLGAQTQAWGTVFRNNKIALQDDNDMEFPAICTVFCENQIAGTGTLTLRFSGYKAIVKDNFRPTADGVTVVVIPTVDGHIIKDNEFFVDAKQGAATGTGAQQTIAHGCSFTPIYSQVLLSERVTGGSLAHLTAAPDATNIYVTATEGVDFTWRVSYNP